MKVATKSPAAVKIPWSGRAFDYSEEEIAAVVEVMRHGDPLTQGQHQARFEREFAAYTGSPHAFAVTNCTNALDLAAILTGVGKGDEVIVPAHTFSATAIPFGRTGAKLVWADIDPKTWVISADSIKSLLTPRTKVVVVVHLYGLMADMEAIAALGEKHGFQIVEDCAQAIGAEQHGRKAGSIGDFGAFSFHCQKSLTTLGEGGVLTVRNEQKAKLVPGLRHNGVRAYPDPRPDYWLPAMSNVDVDIPGVWPYNFCMTEAQAALGSVILPRLDAMNAVRARRAETFKDALKDFPELTFQAVPEERKHAYHLLPAKYDGRAYGMTRDNLIRALWGDHGVKAVVQYHPLYRYPLFQKMGFADHDCPNTDALFDSMVSFPFHLWMSDANFDALIAATREALTRLRG